jgi:hypothetical protein
MKIGIRTCNESVGRLLLVLVVGTIYERRCHCIVLVECVVHHSCASAFSIRRPPTEVSGWLRV